MPWRRTATERREARVITATLRVDGSRSGQDTVARHLVERLDDVARHSGRVVPVCTPGEPSIPLAGLVEQSRRHASALSQLGLRDRETVAFLVEPSVQVLAAIVGCWRLGASVVVLPKMARAGAAAALQRRLAIVRETVRPSLLVHDGLEPDGLSLAAVHVDALTGAAAHSDPGAAVEERDPAGVAVVQLTSGTTGEPRCLALTHGQISDHVDAIAEAAGFRSGRECFVSWLPLYHDMGLIGTTILPLVLGMDLVLGSPAQFLLDPPSWMGWIDRYDGTVTVAPDSGYAVAARVLASCDTLDLSSLRLAINGSEPIAVDAFASFFTNGARHGLDPSAAFCVYGMAEATLAVAFPRPGGGMQIDAFDRPTMESSGYAKPAQAGMPTSVTAAKLGSALPDLELRVTDPATGRLMETRELGEIEIRGPHVIDTPIGEQGPPRGSRWHRTGDLGYVDELGELVVYGRSRDLIIVGGRNISPQDIESSVGRLPGIRMGNVVAFGERDDNGREQLVVVSELSAGVADAALEREVRATVRDAAGVSASRVIFTGRGQLPKTPSGKLQRSECRRRYGSGVPETP